MKPEEMKMEFKVIRSDGVVCMRTEHKSCIPSRAQQREMIAAGYRLIKDGKRVTMKELKCR